ncbi:restriction endonuclease [Demequina sp. NBRC 110057]|uniref:restriction endonuclease n=1 Tax=Demequina sp. NBRC 110057 TaxID=1570346 RepID=UPI000A00A1CB|nr:restriction endonuclease [Demequina sp. NBRC 110057]
MTPFAMQELQVFFSDEGDLAAGCWDRDSHVMRAAVSEHRRDLLELTAGVLAPLAPDHVAAVIRCYDEKVYAARDSDKATVSRALLMRPSTRERLTAWQNRTGIGASSAEDRWFTPVREVLDLVPRIVGDDIGDASESDMKSVYRELGRLSGPLNTQSTDEDPFEDWLNALSLVGTATFQSRPDFDPSTLEPIPYWNARRIQIAVGLAQDARADAAKNFRLAHPETPLPVDQERLEAEVVFRRAERQRIRMRALDAVAILMDPILSAAEALTARMEAERTAAATLKATSRIAVPHPGALPYGASPRGAELWVRDLLRHLGATEAEVTQQSSDGGVDVICKDHLVSVKHYSGSVPVEEVREIFAVATLEGKLAAMWTSGALTSAGVEFAERASIAVVHYDIETGTHEAVNSAGLVMLAEVAHG